MSLADAGAVITEDRRQAALAETFGHLAPLHRWYRGSVTFVHGYYGELTVLDVAIPDLDDSPWFYEGLHLWLCDLTTDPGKVYRWSGSYRWAKNGSHLFPGAVREVDLA